MDNSKDFLKSSYLALSIKLILFSLAKLLPQEKQRRVRQLMNWALDHAYLCMHAHISVHVNTNVCEGKSDCVGSGSCLPMCAQCFACVHVCMCLCLWMRWLWLGPTWILLLNVSGRSRGVEGFGGRGCVCAGRFIGFSQDHSLSLVPS